MTWYYIFKLWFRLLGILRYHNDKTRSKNVVVDIRKTNWEINSEAEVKESRDSHLLVLQPGSKWYMRRAHFYRCPFSLHFQVLFLCIGRWNEDILFAFKPKGMPSVLKDGCALESLKARGEAAIKYAGFWHSIALPFSAAAKSEQLLLAFPCHFPASWKEVSSVFSLRIFPLAGHLDPSSSCILTRHFLYLVNDMIDTWDYQRQTLFPRVAPETKTQRFIPQTSSPCDVQIMVFFHRARMQPGFSGHGPEKEVRGQRSPFVSTSPSFWHLTEVMHLNMMNKYGAPLLSFLAKPEL